MSNKKMKGSLWGLHFQYWLFIFIFEPLDVAPLTRLIDPLLNKFLPVERNLYFYRLMTATVYQNPTFFIYLNSAHEA